jgi:hypothetical protein
MSDITTTEQVPSAEPAPITEETPSSGIRPEPTDHQPKASASSRLRKRKVRAEPITIPSDDPEEEPIPVIVRGIDAGEAYDAVTELEIDDLPAKEQIAELMRLTVRDAETDELVFEEWSNEEIIHLPMDAFSILADAVNKVTGRDGGAGKG